jgi:hypothetical protein
MGTFLPRGFYMIKSILLISLAFFTSLTALAHTEDFFVGPSKRFEFRREGSGERKLVQNSEPDSSVADPCKARIRGLLCLVELFEEGKERVCLAGGESYAPQLTEVYDGLPPKMQKLFCSLKVIFVEKSLEALAYAGVNGVDAQGAFDAVMGIREELLTRDFSINDVFGWKEQKAFGVQAPPFQVLPGSPIVKAKVTGKNTALQYVLTHEIAHVLDFSNEANQLVCKAGEDCKGDQEWDEAFGRKFEPVAGSWTALSWLNWVDPNPRHDFVLHKDLCFYGCNGKGLNLLQMPEFYRQLNAVAYVTTYASVSPMEDFAESTAFHFFNQRPGFEYHVTDPEATYFLNRKWYAMKDKREWIENFYAQDLKYPRIKN